MLFVNDLLSGVSLEERKQQTKLTTEVISSACLFPHMGGPGLFCFVCQSWALLLTTGCFRDSGANLDADSPLPSLPGPVVKSLDWSSSVSLRFLHSAESFDVSLRGYHPGHTSQSPEAPGLQLRSLGPHLAVLPAGGGGGSTNL